MSDSATAGGNMPRSAGFYWTLLPADAVTNQTSYKQGSNWLTHSLSNTGKIGNFTALYTLYLYFTFDTYWMHATPCACGILVFLPALFYKFMLFKLRVKDHCKDINHVQNA